MPLFFFLTALAAGSLPATELTLTGRGTAAEEKFTEAYRIRSFTPYRISFEARKASPKTTGRTLCAGLPGLNVDLDLRDEWTPYSDIVISPSHDQPFSSRPIRFSLWNVTGDVHVRNWHVTEQRALHATDGVITLGAGETLLGTKYVFNDQPGSPRHNHSRPLFSWRGAARLNTDRYPFGNGAEIIWRHHVATRRFLSGEVILAARYFNGGEVLADVSTNGQNWVSLGRLTTSARTLKAPVAAALFPAEMLFIRVRGVATQGVQLGHYSLSAETTGPRLYASGSTRYLDAPENGSPPTLTTPEFHRQDYGECVPGSTPELTLWRARSGWRIPRDREIPRARSKGLEIALAANEIEATQLVLTPAAVLSNVTVTADVPSLETDVLKVAYVTVDRPVDHTSVPGAYPDPLPPQITPLTINARENQPFWIKVKAPKGTAKGRYEGWVTVRGELNTGKRIERKVPLFVDVHGFELPNRMTCKTLFGFYPALVDQYHGLKKREDRLRVYDQYMRKYSEYHLSPSDGATAGLPGWHPVWQGDEPIFNWRDWDEGMTRGFNDYHFTAMRIPNGLGLGGGDAQHRRDPAIGDVKEGDPRYEIRLAKLLKGVQDHLEEKGWLDRVYIYCFDEPREEDNAFVMNGFAKLAKYAPKLQRFLTSPCRQELLGGPQIWCPIAPDLDTPLARERQRLGEEFWLYVCTMPCAPYATEFIDHPAVELRTWLWQSWAENITGVLIWTANLWTSKSVYPDDKRPQNPYVDAQAWSPFATPWGNGDGRLIYPPETVFEDVTSRDTSLKPGPNFDDPVGSIRGEMLRDGIEDYEYFVMLKKLDPANPLLAVPPSVSKSLTDFNKSPDGIEAHRSRLAREIERRLSETGVGNF